MAETLRWKKVDLPTFDKLGIAPPKLSEHEIKEIAHKWLTTFAHNISGNHVDGIVSQLTDNCWWRDLLAMTWDLRTFQSTESIRHFLKDRLAQSQTKNLTIMRAEYDQLYPDLAWLRLHFSFENAVGSGTGVARLVPTKGSGGATAWKACRT